MGIPDEDKMPSWLRDYGEGSKLAQYNSKTGWVDSSTLLVNPKNLLDLADKLADEHIKDFVPHVVQVIKKLETDPGAGDFTELYEVLNSHRTLALDSSNLMREHDKAVMKFVNFVKEMATKYHTADADSSIRLTDVHNDLAAGTKQNQPDPTKQQPAVPPSTAAVPAANLPPATVAPGTDSSGEY